MKFIKSTPVQMLFAVVGGAFACLIAVLLHRTWVNAFLPVGFIFVLVFLLACGVAVRAYLGRVNTYAFALSCALSAYLLANIPGGTVLLVGATIPGEKFWAGQLALVLMVAAFIAPFLATLLPEKLFLQRASKFGTDGTNGGTSNSADIKKRIRTDDADLNFMLELAEKTDQMLENAFLSPDFEQVAGIDHKADGTPVTKLDCQVEEYIRQQIQSNFPHDEILGEEFGSSGQDVSHNVSRSRDADDVIDIQNEQGGRDIDNVSATHDTTSVHATNKHAHYESGVGGNPYNAKRRWIVDPIDGTKNFVRKVPIFATLIALEETTPFGGTRVTKSIVSAPLLQRRWWGNTSGEDAAAWMHYKPAEPTRIKTSTVSKVRDASVSISSRGGWAQADQTLQPNETLLAQFDALTEKSARVRGFGDFYSYMLLAEGNVDIALEPDLELYDIAALIPIVEGAGGKFTSFGGEPWSTRAGIKSSLATANETLRKDVESICSI